MQKAEYNNIVTEILRAIGDTPKNVYQPSDDSFLMLDAVAQLDVKERSVLDIGTGSGILSLFCAKRGACVTVTDIDDSALEHVQKAAKSLGLNIQPILSDIFSNVQGQFDIVLFNPPYLPSSTVEDRTVDGGPSGSSLSNRFLEGLPNHLKENGTAMLLVSSLNDVSSQLEGRSKLQFSIMLKRKLFFEELQVLRVRFRDNLPG